MQKNSGQAWLCLLIAVTYYLACACASIHAVGVSSSKAVGIADIRYTDETYRKYVGKRDKQMPWHDKFDILTKRGYTMTPVQVCTLANLAAAI